MYEIFQSLCADRHVKPSDVSRATGISTATLTSWKQGKYSPKQDKLQKIAEYFDVPVEYLMTGKKPKEYYLNDETVALAQELFDNPHLMGLMKAARKQRPEDVKMAEDMLNRFKETNPDG